MQNWPPKLDMTQEIAKTQDAEHKVTRDSYWTIQHFTDNLLRNPTLQAEKVVHISNTSQLLDKGNPKLKLLGNNPLERRYQQRKKRNIWCRLSRVSVFPELTYIKTRACSHTFCKGSKRLRVCVKKNKQKPTITVLLSKPLWQSHIQE